MKSSALTALLATLCTLPAAAQSIPLVSSWYTAESGKYARIYTTDANKTAGTAVTTWTNGTQTQSSPAYCGVQEISYSTDWVYIRTTGLATHVMGPWYLNATHTTIFPNQPVNRKALYRFPRVPTVPAAKTLTGLGVIGYFVDGVAMFDTRDGFVWTGAAESGNGTGYWNRDAYVNEGATFDPGYAHQEMTGNHHYHANPIALRYKLGDHVDFVPATKTYTESTAPVTKHSPILGWVRDGYPVYGPYGYSTAMNAGSGVRRMVSGFALRNGANGTDNLTAAGRSTIPAWAQRVYGVAAAQSGPAVSTTYPLGRYMEDKAYLGDLGRVQGVDFDLDEYNGRFCVTPEYPAGTYAYFVAINADGSPAFPYNIGRAYYGNPTGNAVTTVAETVTTAFKGGPDIAETTTGLSLAGGNVTLTWSSVEGGTYRVEGGSDLTNWTTLTSTQAAAAGAVSTGYTEVGAASNLRRFYKATRTALATYDPVTGTTGGGGGATITASPATGTRGTTVTVTATIANTATPAVPPQNAGVQTFTLGTIAGTGLTHVSQYVVRGTFVIPAGTAPGPVTATITFAPPPGQANGPSYTQTLAFTIQ